ncbi:NAD-dependent succinate-semialdehyde dehydrogenase, partial [Aurantiacibacter poecillastricola]|uniref:NAD-dependent succinate-semialdehyde dehydrogenase n=1 Tax=Aurantiacibacter poecillastricola TaxID=3064385 RepID=UPI00274002B0
AREAFPAWASETAAARGKVLRRWYDLIGQHRDDLARLITRENGKTFREAQGEVDYAAGFMEFYADEATRALGEIIPANTDGRQLRAEREPVGVTAAITPWNFPLAMLTRKVGPALAAGCTMVAKPASMTPLTALAFARLGEEAGVPRGVLSVLTGSARDIGAAFTSSSTVRKLSFTGSTEIGVQLYRDCAGTMKKLGLELGGNAPLLIFEDADLDTAVETAVTAKFRNGGQSCIAANRIYVQDGIKDAFVSAFAGRVEAMTVGDGFDEASDIGPLIDDDGVAKVREHRDQALASGARCVAGGGDPENRLFPATLLIDVPHDAQLTCEETFGPLAGVIGFDSVEEGLARANDTPFGLAAYMCSS